MGAFYTNVLLRGAASKQALCALRKLRRLAFVASAGHGVTVVYDSKCEQQDTKFLCDLSAALSRDLRCPAWGVLNHDDDVLWYVLFSNGKIADSYNSTPDYFKDSADPEPPEGGDGEVLARLMGHRKSAEKVDNILHATGDLYDFASDRHRDLCKALSINFSAVSCGFNDLDNGRGRLSSVARVGKSPALSAAILKRTHGSPKDGSTGVEKSNWYRVAELEITSGTIEIADLGSVPHDSVRVRVPRGKYQVEARLIDFDRRLKISRLRVFLAGAEFNRGSKCGELSLDFAAVALGDLVSIRKNLSDQEQEKLNRWAVHAIGTTVCAKRFKRLGRNVVELLLCQASLGDLTYPVFRIDERGRAVGFEIEFISDGHLWRSPQPAAKWRRVRWAD